MAKKKRFTPGGVENAPEKPGVYELYEGAELAYVGSANDLRRRLQEHLSEPRFRNATSFQTTKTKTTRLAREKEKNLIKRHGPPKNRKK